MDFNQLMARMRELDQPTQSPAVEECGMAPMNTPNMPAAPEIPPPSLSINLNAQGMDNIESIMKLVTKVNPDMINQPAPPSVPMLTPEPSIMSIKPQGLGDLGNLDAGPLKMLPDLDASEPDGGAHAEPDADNMGGPSDMDADNMPPMGDLDHDEPDADNMGGPSDNDADNKIDVIQKSMGDDDGDGDKDEKDEDDEEEKKEAYGNSAKGDDGSSYLGLNAAIRDGDDLNKPKKSYSDKPYRGDNPMANESTDLRSQIRAELQRRLNESKK